MPANFSGTSGISIEGGSDVAVPNVVISNVSGGTNVMTVDSLAALGAPGLKVVGITITQYSKR